MYSQLHTQPFNGPFSRTTRVGRYQKGKTNLDFTEARDSDWQWHQLGICKSAPRCRQITTPAPHYSVFYRPDALPAAQPTASKHWRQMYSQLIKNKLWGSSQIKPWLAHTCVNSICSTSSYATLNSVNIHDGQGASTNVVRSQTLIVSSGYLLNNQNFMDISVAFDNKPAPKPIISNFPFYLTNVVLYLPPISSEWHNSVTLMSVIDVPETGDCVCSSICIWNMCPLVRLSVIAIDRCMICILMSLLQEFIAIMLLKRLAHPATL